MYVNALNFGVFEHPRDNLTHILMRMSEIHSLHHALRTYATNRAYHRVKESGEFAAIKVALRFVRTNINREFRLIRTLHGQMRAIDQQNVFADFGIF